MQRAAQYTDSSTGEFCWIIHCPACECAHKFDQRWTFNGDFEKPTFRASMLVRWAGGYGEPPAEWVCHSFVTDGQIAFCSDSTHALSGQTVELPAVDE